MTRRTPLPSEAISAQFNSSGFRPWRTQRERALFEDLIELVFFAGMSREEGQLASLRYLWAPDGIQWLESLPGRAPWSEDQAAGWEIWSIVPQEASRQKVAKLARGQPSGGYLIVTAEANRLWIAGSAHLAKSGDGGEAWIVSSPEPGVVLIGQGWKPLLRYDRGEVSWTPPDPFFVSWEDDDPDPGLVADRLIACAGQMAKKSYAGNGIEYFYYQVVREFRRRGSGALLCIGFTRPTPESSFSIQFQDPRRLQKLWLELQSHERRDSSDTTEREARDLTRDELTNAIRHLAGFAQIDGAVLAGPELEFYGAGSMISVPHNQALPKQVCLDRSGQNTEELQLLGGARHRAAAAFVSHEKHGLAFVISEDGEAKCFALNNDDQLVCWLLPPLT